MLDFMNYSSRVRQRVFQEYGIRLRDDSATVHSITNQYRRNEPIESAAFLLKQDWEKRELVLVGIIRNSDSITPHFNERGPAMDAAEKADARARTLRHRILHVLDDDPITPDQMASRLGVAYMDVRKRFSELHHAQLITRVGKGHSALGNPQYTYTRRTEV
jgi:predicted Rossmann fold nucleotide-binding protein DprA/Smf involved in DNA uptake